MSDVYDRLADLAKKRGFYWVSYEIYGGLAGFYDFGPVGVLLKRSIAEEWLKTFVYAFDFMVEVETPVINPQVVFKASGHEDHFTDPIVVCTKCGRVYRADHLVKEATGLNVEGASIEEIWRVIVEKNVRCPECGGELSKPENALLLFKTEIGPYKGQLGYLRPELAQGMFVDFKTVLNIARNRLPLGIAQIGRVARNEISPRQGLLRLREFTIMELEFFHDPSESVREVEEYLPYVEGETLNIVTAESRERGVEEPVTVTVRESINKGIVKNPWLAFWMGVGNKFVRSLGIPPDKTRFFEKLPHERAHYSAQTFDQEVYSAKFGWIEVAGYAYRTDYDLKRHMDYSGVDMFYFKKYEKPVEVVKKRVIVDYKALADRLGERFQEALKVLQGKSQEELYEELSSKGYVEAGGLKIGREFFTLREERSLVHGEKIVPHVVEPSYGVERLLYVLLEYSYNVVEDRVVLKLPPRLAPFHVAVFPLMAGSREEHKAMASLARSIVQNLREGGLRVVYDEEGSIGRRYARADEIGIPYAVTVDHQSLQDGTVTIRFRDTRRQVRVGVGELYDTILKYLRDNTMI
ncbi:glycine--tRNA ligase [Thermogladius sp. KZ2Tp1]|uniref:glycine--tRNA ligase n=1 Tax=Thermogladius sp. KZ2Tp1 TaxID=3136289 RepID=UPI003DAA3CBE